MDMKKILVLFSFILLLGLCISCGDDDTSFQPYDRILSTNAYPQSPRIIVDDEDNVLIMETIIDEDRRENIRLTKLNVNGSTLWSRIYDNSDEDIGRAFLQAQDGNYVIGGETRNPGKDFYFFKVDRNGEVIWEKIFSGDYSESRQSEDYVQDLKQDNSGFLYAAIGARDFDNSGWYANGIVKLDNNGNEVWRRLYNMEYDRPRLALQDDFIYVHGSGGRTIKVSAVTGQQEGDLIDLHDGPVNYNPGLEIIDGRFYYVSGENFRTDTPIGNNGKWIEALPDDALAFMLREQNGLFLVGGYIMENQTVGERPPFVQIIDPSLEMVLKQKLEISDLVVLTDMLLVGEQVFCVGTYRNNQSIYSFLEIFQFNQ